MVQAAALNIMWSYDFPGGSDDKASAYNVGDPDSIPGSGRSPGEGNGNPLQYSCLENPMDGGAWWATVHGVTELDTTEWLHFPFHFPCYKERMYLDQVLPFEQRPSLTQLQTSFQLSSSTSCIYPRKLNEQVHRKTHQWLFLVAKMSKCPSSEQKVSYPFNATLFSCKKVIR